MTTATATRRVQPPTEYDYPAATPASERLPYDFIESKHTAESWAAFITSPAATEADALHFALAALQERLEAWLAAHGHITDPGVHAIEAAGVPVPAYLRRYGTMMRHVADQFRGLVWALDCTVENTRDLIPDTTEEQSSPANVRRLLGLDDPAAERGAV